MSIFVVDQTFKIVFLHHLFFILKMLFKTTDHGFQVLDAVTVDAVEYPFKESSVFIIKLLKLELKPEIQQMFLCHKRLLRKHSDNFL